MARAVHWTRTFPRSGAHFGLPEGILPYLAQNKRGSVKQHPER
jgi:hypothetical protein